MSRGVDPSSTHARAASLPAASVDAPPGAAAWTSGGVEQLLATHRITEAANTGYVLKAVVALEPGARRGGRSRVWDLRRDTLSLMAHAHCVHGRTQDEVIAAHAADLRAQGVRPKSVQRWLSSVHDEYQRLKRRAIDEQALEHDPALAQAVASGDLLTVMARAWGVLGLKLSSIMAASDMTELTKTDMPLLRALEGLTEAAKIQAAGQHSDAKTMRLMIEMRKKVAEVTGSKARRTPTQLRDELFGIIDRVAGLAPDAAVAEVVP